MICEYAGGEPNISSHSYIWKWRFRSVLDGYNFISSILLFLENEEALSLGPSVLIIKALPQSFPWCISGFIIASPLPHSITSIRQERVAVTLRTDTLLTIDLKLPAINSWWTNSPTELWISWWRKIERLCTQLKRENLIVVENSDMMYVIRSENILYRDPCHGSQSRISWTRNWGYSRWRRVATREILSSGSWDVLFGISSWQSLIAILDVYLTTFAINWNQKLVEHTCEGFLIIKLFGVGRFTSNPNLWGGKIFNPYLIQISCGRKTHL